MRVAEIATGPVLGYRLWRILPFQDLEGPPSVRLCSAGTMGVPKFWPVREPVVAVCSGFKTTHAAPWPGHECGLWALDSREAAEARVEGFVDTDNFIGSYGWAVGEVALWGRVIEHEKGYRAQYAYPGALTVTSRREHTARALADAYGVPVEWRRRHRIRAIDEEREVTPPSVVGEARAQLDSVIASLRSLEEEIKKPVPDWRQEWEERQARDLAELRSLPPLVAPTDLTTEEMLVAFVGSIARSAEWSYSVTVADVDQDRKKRVDRDLQEGVSPGEVCDVLLWQRGERGAFAASAPRGPVVRPGYQAVLSATVKQLVGLETDGLLEGGKIRYRGVSRRWFLTPAGRGFALDVCRAKSITVPLRRDEFQTIELAPIVALIATSSVQREIFDHERAVLAPRWMEERRRAQARGSAAYARWLKRARKGDKDMLRFTDDEVASALDELVRDTSSPVELTAVRDRLTPPGPGQDLGGESARLSGQLLRLLNQGRVKRIKQAAGPNLWLPAARARDAVSA